MEIDRTPLCKSCQKIELKTTCHMFDWQCHWHYYSECRGRTDFRRFWVFKYNISEHNQLRKVQKVIAQSPHSRTKQANTSQTVRIDLVRYCHVHIPTRSSWDKDKSTHNLYKRECDVIYVRVYLHISEIVICMQDMTITFLMYYY